jgi:hypothetical protein
VRRAWIGLALALQACAGREPAVQECAAPAPGLVDRLRRGERAVHDLRAEDARHDFEYVLEVAAWMPPGVDAVELRRRAVDGLLQVRGILQER